MKTLIQLLLMTVIIFIKHVGPMGGIKLALFNNLKFYIRMLDFMYLILAFFKMSKFCLVLVIDPIGGLEESRVTTMISNSSDPFRLQLANIKLLFRAKEKSLKHDLLIEFILNSHLKLLLYLWLKADFTLDNRLVPSTEELLPETKVPGVIATNAFNSLKAGEAYKVHILEPTLLVELYHRPDRNGFLTDLYRFALLFIVKEPVPIPARVDLLCQKRQQLITELKLVGHLVP